MIINLQKFIESERVYWEELESLLDRRERDAFGRLTLEQVRRFHYLYERVSSDLGKVATFSSEPEIRLYLERLVARAYGDIHENRSIPHRLRPLHWLIHVFPATFRRHSKAFALSAALTLGGTLLGAGLIAVDPGAREIILPYEHLLQSPAKRVAEEERVVENRLKGSRAQGAAFYISHNTQVAITTMALGMTWGIGTVLFLVANGIMLGAVGLDYIIAGKTQFLLAWLLPHGAAEIPAILLAGQAGFVLAGALIGWGRRMPLRTRLRHVTPDLLTLITGVALMLVWAGIIEAFLSQYHQPVLPYTLKILLGLAEIAALVIYLGWCGRKACRPDAASRPGPGNQGGSPETETTP